MIYPEIDNGHVVADATVQELGDYFVNERVRDWGSAGQRQAIVIPVALVRTHSGIDYARVWFGGGQAIEVPIQRGQTIHRPGRGETIEVLSGLNAGDRLIKP